MEKILTVIAVKDFTLTPGGRYVTDGKYSGEEFLNTLLKPAFENALKDGSEILVDLDGTEGYPTSFLEESFGGLARLYPDKQILNFISIKSDEEPIVIEEVKGYIRDANNIPRNKPMRSR